MATKESLYGLLSPKKLNPNLIAVVVTIVVLTLILVFSGHHSRIIVTKVVSIETNIPAPMADTSKTLKRSP